MDNTNKFFRGLARHMSLVFLMSLLLAAHARSEMSPDSLNESLVDLYENNRCLTIIQEYRLHAKLEFPGIVLAIVGTCAPDRAEGADLFKKAEELRPNNQAILILHAQWMGKKDREAAKEIWRRVRMVARDESVKRLAEDYMSGVISAEEEEQFSIGKKWSGWIFGQLDTTYTSNPLGNSISAYDANDRSWGNGYTVMSRALKTTNWGDWGGQFNLSVLDYYHTHGADDNSVYLSPHASLSVGDAGSVVFRPYASHETLNHASYQDAYGLSVMGIYYGDSYRQSVQAILYRNKYFDPTQASQQGYHFRFEYEWEFFPTGYEIDLGAYLEHVLASSDTDSDYSANLYYSHNDNGLYSTLKARYQMVEFFLSLNFATRQDTNTSSYTIGTNKISKRRQDYSMDIKPGIFIPLEQFTKLSLFYEYYRNNSNMGSDDYQDYQVLNHVVGANIDFQLEWL